MRTSRRLLGAVLSIVAIVAVTAAVAAAVPSAKGGKGKKDSGTAYFSFNRSAGGYQYASGYSVDKLFGLTAATYKIKVSTATAGVVTANVKNLTVWTKTGTLTGTASAQQNLATGAVNDGKFNLTKGTGALKGHSFVGTFSGSGSTTSNQYHYTYTGTYR